MPHRIGCRPITIFLTNDEGMPVGRPVILERAVLRLSSGGGLPSYRAKIFGQEVDLRVKGHEEGYSCRFPEADATEAARREAGLALGEDPDDGIVPPGPQ